MALGNVPKLYGFIALLAGVIAVPAGCSGDDFKGCKATRTCPSKGGTSGTGGEAGGGNDTGGTSSSGTSGTSGTAGTSGTDNGGEGGTGGTTDDTDRPTIVSFSPDDADVDVERDVAVTVTFSEPIDATTVTETNVVLTGPDGDVPGTLSVDGEVVSFVPERKLYLLGEYTLTISDGVADLAGNTLGEEASVGFRVRDGRWGAITTPFGRTPRHLGGFARNAAGDVVVGGGQPTEPATTFWAAVYNASTNVWRTAEMTPSQAGVFVTNYRGMSIDLERRAAFVWYGGPSGGWFRSTEEGEWTDMGTLPGYPALCATSEGRATAVWPGNGMLTSRVADLGVGTLGPVMPLWSREVAILSDLQLVSSLERVALLERISDGANKQITVAWQDPALGWSDPAPIATAADITSIGAPKAMVTGTSL